MHEEAMHTSEEAVVRVSGSGPVRVITLSRPETLNAVDAAVLDGLEESLDAVEADPEARVIIITGAGKAFAAGGDIRAMRDMDVPAGRAFSTRGHQILARFEASRLVIIAAVNGFALGGGTEIALACDLRIASDTAQFGLPEVKVGLFPGWGGSQRISRVVGTGNGRHLVLSGEHIPAARAREIGLVSEVVAPQDLMGAAEELALRIAANSPTGVEQAKRAMVGGETLPLEYALAYEIEAWLVNFATDNRVEGLTAFLEKREPLWKQSGGP